MYYSDSAKQATEYLRLTLRYMGRHGIPVDPMNYTVWYEYVSGRNEQLKAAIEELLKSSQQFTDEINQELYNRYISEEKKDIVKAIYIEMRRILHGIVNHFQITGGEISVIGKELETCANHLADFTDIQGIRRIVDTVIDRIKTVVESSAQTRERLAAATLEVEALNRKLGELKEEATTDALTGLVNRKGFEKALLQESNRAETSAGMLSLVMTDIDHFKRINDTYGHLVGDEVLRNTASMLNDLTRGNDIVARFGGEEFMLILPDTPLEGAVALSEKIRTSFQSMRWRKKSTGKSLGSITLSFGVALYRPGEPLEAFIQRADRALYKSKNNGRNRVTSE